MSQYINYYLIFHVLAGFYVVDWYYEFMGKEAKKVGVPFKADNPKEVVTIYLIWTVLVPLLLLVYYWPIIQIKK